MFGRSPRGQWEPIEPADVFAGMIITLVVLGGLSGVAMAILWLCDAR